jgi:hypothetical protein
MRDERIVVGAQRIPIRAGDVLDAVVEACFNHDVMMPSTTLQNDQQMYEPVIPVCAGTTGKVGQPVGLP